MTSAKAQPLGKVTGGTGRVYEKYLSGFNSARGSDASSHREKDTWPKR